MTRDRFTLVWWTLLGLTGLVLCGIPLFDLLGFEFAFVVGIPLSLYGGACGVRARRTLDPLPAWRRATKQVLIASLVPLALITLNALRVQNCDYLEGLAFYAILPLTGGTVAAGWGVALGRLAPRRGVWLFALAVLVTTALAIRRFWIDPPVDAFHPLFGYWPGALYDDVIHIDDRLFVSRLEDLAVALALVVLSGAERSLGWLVRAAGAIALAGAVYSAAVFCAVHRDADWIAERLGGRIETEHVVVHYPWRWKSEDVRALADELEFAYAELRDFFGFDLSRKATVWLYTDDRSKKRLMGARRVRIAKPWQWSFHVHAPQVGQAVLVHEMAHVFSAEIAESPHHLSLYRGVVPHMPLIEGLAEAATWKTDRLDLHEWSAAMRAIGVAPPLTEVLAPTGFYGRNSRTAYTLVGSFARFYRDRYGTDALAAAYRAGAFPDIERLIGEWQAHLDRQTLAPEALEFARARYDRPAIFGRACAHEIAALRAATAGAKPEEALALTERVLDHLPDDVRGRHDRLAVLMRLGRWDAARIAAADLIEDERAGAVARALAVERLADLNGLAGDLAAARTGYTAALETAFARSDLRRLRIKQLALDAGEAGQRALRYLALPRRNVEQRVEAGAIVALAPDWPAGRYLRGRARLEDEPIEALVDLLAARALDDPSIAIEVERLIALVHFDRGCHAVAAPRFAALADDTRLDAGEALEMARWHRRSRLFGARRGAEPPPVVCDTLARVLAEIDTTAPRLDDAAHADPPRDEAAE